MAPETGSQGQSPRDRLQGTGPQEQGNSEDWQRLKGSSCEARFSETNKLITHKLSNWHKEFFRTADWKLIRTKYDDEVLIKEMQGLIDLKGMMDDVNVQIDKMWLSVDAMSVS